MVVYVPGLFIADDRLRQISYGRMNRYGHRIHHENIVTLGDKTLPFQSYNFQAVRDKIIINSSLPTLRPFRLSLSSLQYYKCSYCDQSYNKSKDDVMIIRCNCIFPFSLYKYY